LRHSLEPQQAVEHRVVVANEGVHGAQQVQGQNALRRHQRGFKIVRAASTLLEELRSVCEDLGVLDGRLWGRAWCLFRFEGARFYISCLGGVTVYKSPRERRTDQDGRRKGAISSSTRHGGNRRSWPRAGPLLPSISAGQGPFVDEHNDWKSDWWPLVGDCPRAVLLVRLDANCPRTFTFVVEGGRTWEPSGPPRLPYALRCFGMGGIIN